MDEATAAALDEINGHFYERWASQFDATRRRPWHGWRRLLRGLPHDGSPGHGRPLRVLDVGCGNGRLGLFLADERRAAAFAYLGIDASLPLLALARRRLPATWRLAKADVTATSRLDFVRPASFSLVAAFGLLHHVAGFARRRTLLSTMAETLRPGGLLWLSFWQFDRDPRLRRRSIPWEEYNRSATHPIDPSCLEAGDLLQRWGEAGAGAVRYCHSTDPGEAESLLRGLDLEPEDRFEDDGPAGNLNHYLALRRTDR